MGQGDHLWTDRRSDPVSFFHGVHGKNNLAAMNALYSLLARKRIHGPADSDSDYQEKEEGPQDIFQAIFWLAPSQIAERYGNDCGKKQKSLNMCQRKTASHAHAFRPRAASKACKAARRFNTPAVAKNRVP